MVGTKIAIKMCGTLYSKFIVDLDYRLGFSTSQILGDFEMNHYDQYGNYLGYTDGLGQHRDQYGSVSGYTDGLGQHRDQYGNVTGYTDGLGQHRDQYGNVIGYSY